MRVAALYDIHANLPALEAVLEEIRGASVDQIVIGGDLFPGPMPVEALACLLDCRVPVRFIHGNGDREVLAQLAGSESEWYQRAPEQWREPVRWTAQQLHQDHQRLLGSWPATYRVATIGLGEVLFCHATPRNDAECFTRQTPEDRLLPIFAVAGAPLVICGHTHMQFDRMVGNVRVVNAGSVGMPFGEPGAYWLMLGPDVQLRRTLYDLSKAAERIRGTAYPQADEFAARHVLQPPSEAEMLAQFGRVELK
jgi:predicted phosphodiesterase